jgi:hypothetical protein
VNYRSLLLALPLLITACIFEAEKVAHGGGSDTETLTGLVTTPEGTPSARTWVKLIPADYDPSHPDTTLIHRAMTDDSGRFLFEKIAKGKAYNIIAGSAADKSWAYAPGVEAGAVKGRLTLNLALAKVFLFELHTENYSSLDSGIAFFPGTDIFTRCDGVSFSKVDSVPTGALRFVVRSRAGWSHDTTLASVVDTAKVLATRNGVQLYP